MKTVVFSFGRMQPPTTGHLKLVDKINAVARSERATPQLYLSHSQDKAKNPLSYDDKYKYARQAFGSVVQKSRSRIIFDILKELDKNFDSIIMIVGSDRVNEFEKLLNKYNGKEYNFDSIRVVSAGERDPDADDVSGMSASKMRALAAENDFTAFKKGLPKNLQRGKTPQQIFDKIRDAMGITEDMSVEESLELLEASILQQRQQQRKLVYRIKEKVSNLSAAQEPQVQINEQVDVRKDLVQKLVERFSSQVSVKPHHQRKANEEFNLIAELSSIVDSVERYKLSENIQANLRKKSERYNIPLEELKQAYLKYKSTYTEQIKSEQLTFQSLNSMLANRSKEIREAIEYHMENDIPFYENVFRMYSDNYFQLFREARVLYSKGLLTLSAADEELINTDIGEFGIYEENGRRERVPLDCPLISEEDEKDVELNKPKRGGSKKFYVYVKDPQTGNIKKVEFGDTGGLQVKLDDKEAASSFAARHQCSQKKDKTKPGYWACRLPRYAKELGLSGGGSHFW